MEKSIETIWKEGFVKSDTCMPPKFVNFYNQKSKHLITRIKNNMDSLLQATIPVFVIIFTMFMIFEMILTGFFILITGTLCYLAGKRQLTLLNKIDFGSNPYEYLTNFQTWWNHTISAESKIIKYVLPFVILIIIGLQIFQLFLKNPTRLEQIANDSVAIYILIGILTIVCFFYIFGIAMYKKAVNLIYGKEIKKINELISDMEELRN